MYIVYVCILAPILVNGFSLIEETADLNSVSSYETNDDNVDLEIWDAVDDVGVVDFENISKTQLKEICTNRNSLVYISAEDVTIDCRTFNMGQLPVEASQTRIKRQALEEGSGFIPEENQNEENAISNEDPATTTLNGDEESQTEQSAIQNSETKQEQENTENKQEQTTEQSAIEVQSINPLDEKETVDNIENKEEETTEQAESEKSATSVTEKTVDNTNENQLYNNTDAVQQTTDPTVSHIKETVAKEDYEEEEPITKQSEKEKPLTPSENETDKTQQKQSEQSNNKTITDDDEVDKKKQVEVFKKHTGKTLISNTQAKETTDTDQSVKSDGSTQDTQTAGSKDTTILIFLFVAVVVVGAMAFGYNFIKKRKQRSAGTADLEKGDSNKKEAKLDSEPEQKPLIEDKREFEMTDMKKATSSKEILENVPSDVTVKT